MKNYYLAPMQRRRRIEKKIRGKRTPRKMGTKPEESEKKWPYMKKQFIQ